MAQQEIGHPGEALSHPQAHLVYIPGHQIPTAPGPEVAEFSISGAGLSMAQMILPAHPVTPLCQKPGKTVIASHMLGHPMDNLHHRPGRILGRLPQAGAATVLPIAGWEGEFGHSYHGSTLPFPFGLVSPPGCTLSLPAFPQLVNFLISPPSRAQS